MSEHELTSLLNRLRSLPGETEVVEFKEAKNNFDFGELGKYFSALSNEANLAGKPCAWLVFGIKDKGLSIVGSRYRSNRADLDSLKREIAEQTTAQISFIEIHELLLPEARVVFFQIPAAPKGIPVAFKGHYFGRNGESLSALNIEEIERIRSQATQEDWSVGICPDATLDDLDAEAISKARQNFINKFPDKAEEAKGWDNATFLNKAKLTLRGKITRTAIILLGKGESEHFINPAEAKIRWLLKDVKGNDRDYHIEACPLLLAVDKIYHKIRNLKYRYLKEGTLFPDEVLQYEPFVIREALNNCIAHQDYKMGGRINVVEMEDQMVFTNKGNFIPGSVEKVVIENAPEENYRNPFLVTAMFNLNMVETLGGGIRKIFNYQIERRFPLPDYDFADQRVKATITGKILDIDFARTLARRGDLSLEEILILDKVQKRRPITETEAKHLKAKELIEGRKPNFIISAHVAVVDQGLKVQYINRKGFDDAYYKDMVVEFIQKYKQASKKDIEQLILGKLPDILTPKQKQYKINNLVTALRKERRIKNTGNTNKPNWVIP